MEEDDDDAAEEDSKCRSLRIRVDDLLACLEH